MQKIDGTTIHDAEVLDLFIPMYSLLEYSSNYSETAGSLWFCSKGGMQQMWNFEKYSKCCLMKVFK